MLGRWKQDFATYGDQEFSGQEQPHDLELRGPSEFYGICQSGLPDFHLANLITDIDMIQVVREAAWEIVTADPHLEWDEHAPLIQALERFLG